MNIILPGGFNYSCVNCGECCGGWDIEIDTETYKTLSHIKWERKVFIESDSKKYFERLDEKCIFLEDDNFCLLHKKFGLNAKSNVCRAYPFWFIETPDGIVVRLSFVCQSVIKNSGVSLESRIEEIKQLEPIWKIRKIDETVNIGEDCSVGWCDYKKIENVIFELLNTGENFEESLKAVSKFLKIVLKGLRKNQTVDNMVSLENFATMSFPNVPIGNPSPGINKGKQKLYIALFAGYEFAGRAKISAVKKCLNLIKLVFGKGTLELDGQKFNISQINKTQFNIENKALLCLIKRYIEHLIFSKWHLLNTKVASHNVISGYSLLLIVYALVRWYSIAFAVSRKNAFVELCDLEKAIAYVDRNYAGHISKETLFLNSPVFAKICTLLISQEKFEEVII